MTFKQNWEKTNQRFSLPQEKLTAMVAQAYPGSQLLQYEIIAGGCANLNIKVWLENEAQPLILRVYLRDKAAAFREQKLAILLHKTIPIPQVYFIGDEGEYRFAIMEYREGITLRELLLGNQSYDMTSIMYEVGQILAKLQANQFVRSGMFDENLKVAEFIIPADYMTFATSCLTHPRIVETLGDEIIAKLRFYFEKYNVYFPDEDQHHLVHADFDPANILVVNRQGKWQISAILDWEFAFSSSSLWDVANMLRYSHHMPDTFEKAFLKGLRQGGAELIENWRICIYLLNCLSLLDCLERTSSQNQPNQCKDIIELIDHFLEKLRKS